MNQKARKLTNAILVVVLLAQTILLPNYVYAQQVIAVPPGAAQIIENGERFMDSAPVAIGNSLQLAQSLEQIAQSDLQTVPEEWLLVARQEALQVAQQTAVAQGALGGILAGAEELEISTQAAVDLDALVTDISANGFSEELKTAFVDAGLTITQVMTLETGAADNFNLRREVAQNGFNLETVALLQSLGLSTTDIADVEETYANYGVADASLPDKLAQLDGTQAELTFVRDSALVAYIQLLSQQVFRAQLNEEMGRAITTADVDALAEDQLRLLTHIGYLNTLWGGETRPDVGEGQWLFVERYSWRVAERLTALILETHNLGLAVDLFIALQIHTAALTAQAGDPVQAKAELDKLAEIQAVLAGDNAPGGQATLQSTPSLLWRVAIAVYDSTGEDELLQWVSRDEIAVADSAVTVATEQAYGRLTRLGKPAQLPAFSGNVDESDETNNTDLALFYTSRAALPDNILSLLEGFIPNFEDVLDFVWGVISGQSDNPLAIGINIVLSFVPVLGEVLDLIALFTEPTVWGKAMALIGLAASIASDGSQLLAFLGITIPVAVTTEIADIAASILKNVTKFISDEAVSVIARIPFDQALHRGVEVIEFIGRRIIEGGGNLITRIETVLNNSKAAFTALLTRFGNNLDTLYRIGFREGGYLVGRLLNLGGETATYSDELLETVARVGDEVAESGAALSDEAVNGLDELASRLPSNKTDEILNNFCPVSVSRTNGATYASSYALKDHLGKPAAQTPVNCREIVEEIFGSLTGWSDEALNGLQRLADDTGWTGTQIADLLDNFRRADPNSALARGLQPALASLNGVNVRNWVPDQAVIENMAVFLGKGNANSNYITRLLNDTISSQTDEFFNTQFTNILNKLDGDTALLAMTAPGFNPAVRDGIITDLRRIAHPNSDPVFAHGRNFQIHQAKFYYGNGTNNRLASYELPQSGARPQLDLVLIDDTIVETKYWTINQLNEQIDGLVDQVRRQVQYQATVHPDKLVVVEFARTVGDPIEVADLATVQTRLQQAGVDLSKVDLRIVVNTHLN
ncbi:MAG: hypothetical protein KJ069_14890 [Anaerolineae bacterium]|nr:hypothetical protein [Anaerolineae bacterium]